ncbi:phosphoribosyltransferase-like protein [Salinisphaera shabanensis]|uniref:phosphoribosyltransferase-like protein n=1 Tax=Salinisphaera shabanensis TaxID=180542 RepID=UPI003DA6EB1C
MLDITKTGKAQNWLRQFHQHDYSSAYTLLQQIRFVRTDDVRIWLADQLICHSRDEWLALYAERELAPGSRFFPKLDPSTRRRRSVGKRGPAFVAPPRGSQRVGSEGIIGNVLSEVHGRNDCKTRLSPGPDILRPKKTRDAIRRLAIVTDNIGSGDRILKILDAMRKTRSIYSWKSHLHVPLEIIVFAYSTSSHGLKRIQNHSLAPRVVNCRVSSDLWTPFQNAEEVRDLCVKYDPGGTDENETALGYKSSGTLTVFGHGCPNTVPRILWKSTRVWVPLFPQRSAVNFSSFDKASDIEKFTKQFLQFDEPRLSEPALLERFSTTTRAALLTLIAISRGLHDAIKLSCRTDLDMATVTVLLDVFKSAGWISASNVITDRGLAELRAARRVRGAGRAYPEDHVSVYCPTSLRG